MNITAGFHSADFIAKVTACMIVTAYVRTMKLTCGSFELFRTGTQPAVHIVHAVRTGNAENSQEGTVFISICLSIHNGDALG